MYKSNPVNINFNPAITNQELVLYDEFTDEIIEKKSLNGVKKYLGVKLDNLNKGHHVSYAIIKKDSEKPFEDYKRGRILPIQIDEASGLNYITYEHKVSDKLFVIFSSSVENHKFNYLNQFKKYAVNQLYITDENDEGLDTTCSYYIGQGNFSYEEKIKILIEKERIRLNIEKKDVVLFGSSKGGFAALYFTFKYGYGSALLGSPTVYLGKMHKDNERGQKIIKHIMGDNDQEAIKKLNDLITNEVEKSTHRPHLYYHVGEQEPRYTKHAVHLLKQIDAGDKATYELDLGPYSDHSKVAKYFPLYAHTILSRLTNKEK